jgi:hypothetical protein
MQYDDARVVQAVLAVLQLTAHKDGPVVRAWKGIDFAVMERLHELGYIEDPRNKYKSVVFTDAGAEAAEAAAASLFAPPGTTSRAASV